MSNQKFDENYEVFKIPKRRGGMRQIEAPSEELKTQQKASINKLSYRFKVSPFAHAFCHTRNIVSMAQPHVGQPYVLAIDLSDFFPSIKYDNFKKVIKHQFTAKERRSKPERQKLFTELDKHFYDFKDGKGVRLPQGAPGSPALSNIYLHKLDWRMAWLAYAKQAQYSRYADDLVFSGDSEQDLWAMYYTAKTVLKNDYHLDINPRKIRMMPAARRQMCCGLVVNERIRAPKKWRKRLRAALHQQKELPEYTDDVKGMISFQHMIDNPPDCSDSIELCTLLAISRRL